MILFPYARLRASVLTLSLACIAAAPAPAAAQSLSEEEQQETLLALTMVSVTTARCEFEIAPERSEQIAESAGMLTALLGMSDEEIELYVNEVALRMEERGWDELCDPEGEWAEAYRRLVDTFGEPEPEEE